MILNFFNFLFEYEIDLILSELIIFSSPNFEEDLKSSNFDFIRIFDAILRRDHLRSFQLRAV